MDKGFLSTLGWDWLAFSWLECSGRRNGMIERLVGRVLFSVAGLESGFGQVLASIMPCQLAAFFDVNRTGS